MNAALESQYKISADIAKTEESLARSDDGEFFVENQKGAIAVLSLCKVNAFWFLWILLGLNGRNIQEVMTFESVTTPCVMSLLKRES